jgi:hypothetical protein
MTTTPRWNKKQHALLDAIYAARSTGENQEVVIGTDTFKVTMTMVDRECYDFEPTPTATIKMNNRRIARQAALAILD